MSFYALFFELTVSWLPTPLSVCLETLHAHSADSYLLFDVHHAQRLELWGNSIGNEGLTAFAKAVESGALAPGADVFLRGNSATETGKQAMRDAAKARDLSVHF